MFFTYIILPGPCGSCVITIPVSEEAAVPREGKGLAQGHVATRGLREATYACLDHLDPGWFLLQQTPRRGAGQLESPVL